MPDAPRVVGVEVDLPDGLAEPIGRIGVLAPKAVDKFVTSINLLVSSICMNLCSKKRIIECDS